MSDEKQKIIVVRESLPRSIIQDVFTFGMLTFTVSFGHYLGSNVLQVIAGFCWVVWVFRKAYKLFNDSKMTISEAREQLNKWEAEVAK